MILKINGFENKLKIRENEVEIIEILNSKCYSHIINEINQKVNGIEDSNEIFLLDDEENEIKFKENAYMVFDIFNINYNSKTILNKLYSIIDKNIEVSGSYEIYNLYIKMRNLIIQEINELPFEFEMEDNMKIVDLLKLYELKIDTSNYINVINKIEILIDLISTLKIAKILIIPNLKLFLNSEELVELYKYSLYNNINLISIERNLTEKLEYEKHFIIDENFYDFIEE